MESAKKELVTLLVVGALIGAVLAASASEPAAPFKAPERRAKVSSVGQR